MTIDELDLKISKGTKLIDINPILIKPTQIQPYQTMFSSQIEFDQIQDWEIF